MHQGQIKPLADKVEIIRNYKIPHTKKQMHAFWALASYYRRFIPHFGKGNGSIRCNDMQQRAFENVKRVLCQDVIFHTPDFSLPFVLQVDMLGPGGRGCTFPKGQGR